MFSKLIELIKEAIRHMVAYETVEDTMQSDTYTISSEMETAIDVWEDVYKDKSPWLNRDKGVFSLGLGKAICQSLATQVMSESTVNIITPVDDTEETQQTEVGSRAYFLQKAFDNHIKPKLVNKVEEAMAFGGMVIKPYINNDEIYFDFSMQGQFYPLAFDDDGNITDIAFLDQFVSDGKVFTKIERQTFNDNEILVQNKVFVAKERSVDDNHTQELGNEIPIENIERWKDISPEVTISGVEKPLFGYYRTPINNNIDLDCPLGISIFAPALSMIERCDRQFSRLDWEYEGGQMAIDVDPMALRTTSGYYGTRFEQDELRDRLYRGLDLGEDTYNAFAPTLRDANFQAGLNFYLTKVEDICGLSRGTLSSIDSEARTATELKILKQRTYVTIHSNQESLEHCINDLMYAVDVYATLYSLTPDGRYEVNIDWSDSVLTDVDTELEQRIQLQQEGILSKAENRAWFTGEDLETAKQVIEEIEEANDKGLDDIFTMGRNANRTLEQDEVIEEVEE